MSSLSSFSLSDMIRCQSELRRTGGGARSMEEVARRTVDHLYSHFRDPVTGEETSVLVRFYKTHPFGELPEDLQKFASKVSPEHGLEADTKCLALLASRGVEPEWNDRRESRRHQAIPLPGPNVVRQSPMIAQLITQFGLDIANVVAPDPNLLVRLEQRTYNVFHVPDAAGSPFVPAQDFVTNYGVRSVVGFGGILPAGDLFAVVIFTREHVRREVAEFFQTVALSVKVAVLPFVAAPTFEPSAALPLVP